MTPKDQWVKQNSIQDTLMLNHASLKENVQENLVSISKSTIRDFIVVRPSQHMTKCLLHGPIRTINFIKTLRFTQAILILWLVEIHGNSAIIMIFTGKLVSPETVALNYT